MATNHTPSVPSAARRPTMADVAELAGVGVKTVSRVINGEPYVSEALTERVRAAARTLDYSPNPHAGQLRSRSPRNLTIGLCVGNVENPFDAELHRVIEDISREHGAAVFASSSDDDPAKERRNIDAFLRRRLDALVITTVMDDQNHLLAEQGRGLTIVYVDRVPRGIDADAIVGDNVGGAVAATRHLLEYGHRRIACLCDRERITTAVERRRGFQSEMARAGVPDRDAIAIGEVYDSNDAYAATLELMGRADPPTALFTAKNLISLGAIRALRDLRLNRQVALVGFDEVPSGDLLDPPVTVVTQDTHTMGVLAAERTFARVAGEASPTRAYTVATHLIARGSGEIASPSPEPRPRATASR